MSPTDVANSLPPASCHQSKKPYYCSALLRTHFYGFFLLDLVQGKLCYVANLADLADTCPSSHYHESKIRELGNWWSGIFASHEYSSL